MCNPNGFKLVGDAVNPFGDFNKRQRDLVNQANQDTADRAKAIRSANNEPAQQSQAEILRDKFKQNPAVFRPLI